MADKAERAAENGRMEVVYNVTKTLVVREGKSVAVKDKHGELKTEKQEARWVEHFTEVLKGEEPSITSDASQ